MKIVIAPDSFKGSITAKEAAKAIEKGIKKAFPHAETILFPVADGGEGTMETLVSATKGRFITTVVKGPLGKPVEAQYGVLGDNFTCIIEIASASGLYLVDKNERNPMLTTSYGVGELIKHALEEGYRNFILALGGSATNDGGAGMLQALGMQLLNEENEEIGFGGQELKLLQTISCTNFDQRIKECSFLIASDVENPFIGVQGASKIFGPQKGATKEMTHILDENLSHFADIIEKKIGLRIHNLRGAGAAGGIGGVVQAFFPSTIERGIDIVIEYSKIEQALKDASLVITGEGQVDHQTAFGKTAMGIAQIAEKNNIPTIILAGSIGDKIEKLYDLGIISVFSIINKPMTLELAMSDAASLLEQTAEQVSRTYYSNMKFTNQYN
ncbi:glycerate kinase [Bacillus sp. IITD106]|nr:glycerate kinase [Bacillus sp. IITD106]